MQGVTFDVDGTLYDSWAQQLRAAPHLWRSPRLISAFKRQFETLRGERFDDFQSELIQRIANDLQFDQDLVKEQVEQTIYKDWPATFSEKTPLKELPQLLQAIDTAGIPRAIISDLPSHSKLERMGLSEGWAAVVDCSSLGALKPLSDGLQAASDLMNIPANRLVHIGDREDTDGAMARKLGAGFLMRGKIWNSVSDLAVELGLDLPRHSS